MTHERSEIRASAGKSLLLAAKTPPNLHYVSHLRGQIMFSVQHLLRTPAYIYYSCAVYIAVAGPLTCGSLLAPFWWPFSRSSGHLIPLSNFSPPFIYRNLKP